MNRISPPDSQFPYQSQATLDLVDRLSPYVEFVTVKAGTRLPYVIDDVNMCYIIQSGVIRLRQEKEDIILGTPPVPNVAGLTNLLGTAVMADLCLEAISECQIAILPLEQVRLLINEHNAWELLAGHIAKITNNLFIHNTTMTAPTTYEVLRFQLTKLLREPATIRESVSAANYILQRTRLSRSTVMKMLAQLKQGEYIVLEEGILKAINHLPAKY